MQKENQPNNEEQFDKTYRIPYNRPEEWKAYLAENGFVVVADYMPKQEVTKHFDSVWDMMEKLSLKKLLRQDYETQRVKKNYPSSHHGGLMQYIGHSEMQWEVRKRVKPIFQQLWGCKDLKTSFDGICFANGALNFQKKSEHEGLHVDQSLYNFQIESYQGILALSDAGDNGGGFVCVPKSHKYFEQYWKNKQDLPKSVPKQDRETQPLCNFVKVNSKAGDFILFESRTFHCGTVPFNKNLRVCTYVCMMPTASVPKEKQTEREIAFAKRMNSGHNCATNFRTFPIMPKKHPKNEWEKNQFALKIREINRVGIEDLQKDQQIMKMV